MITIETALELSRQRIAEAGERATLGEPPAPRPMFPFLRRNVVSLAGIVEVRRNADKETHPPPPARALDRCPARSERKAS